MSLASCFMGQALHLPPASSRSIDVQRELRVPMPDGVVLLADWYARSPSTGDPLGTAVTLVPAQQRVFHDSATRPR